MFPREQSALVGKTWQSSWWQRVWQWRLHTRRQTRHRTLRLEPEVGEVYLQRSTYAKLFSTLKFLHLLKIAPLSGNCTLKCMSVRDQFSHSKHGVCSAPRGPVHQSNCKSPHCFNRQTLQKSSISASWDLCKAHFFLCGNIYLIKKYRSSVCNPCCPHLQMCLHSQTSQLFTPSTLGSSLHSNYKDN